MAQYGRPDYWAERYARDPEPFDWYTRYSKLRAIITHAGARDAPVLVPGCGNSRLSEEMLDDGFEAGIANIDISRAVIDAQAERHKARAGLTWQVMNASTLSFPDASFGCVVDKATLDSLLCGENSTENIRRYCSEVSRVLRPGGAFIVVSYGSPENRLSYLEGDFSWSVAVHTVPKPTVNTAGLPDATDPTACHYVYVCKKSG